MKKFGFTLTELLITVSIIAILVTIALAAYSTINKQSRDTKRKNDLEQIRSALEMYKADNGFYPAVNVDGTFGAASNLAATLTPTYVALIPSDPLSTQIYGFEVLNAVGANYYGYCLCTKLESQSGSNTCTVSLPANCNYGYIWSYHYHDLLKYATIIKRKNRRTTLKAAATIHSAQGRTHNRMQIICLFQTEVNRLG